jgi:hypothetical protein
MKSREFRKRGREGGRERKDRKREGDEDGTMVLSREP